MPTLKMYISGTLVDSTTISFEGMDKEERAAHTEGFCKWLKNKNIVPPGEYYEIILDGVESKGNPRFEKIKGKMNIPLVTYYKKESLPMRYIKPIQVRPQAKYSNTDFRDYSI